MTPWHAIELVWAAFAVVIGGGVWRLAAAHGYRGRHRLADRPHLAAPVRSVAPVAVWIPRPRSPFGTPELLDEWVEVAT